MAELMNIPCSSHEIEEPIMGLVLPCPMTTSHTPFRGKTQSTDRIVIFIFGWSTLFPELGTTSAGTNLIIEFAYLLLPVHFD